MLVFGLCVWIGLGYWTHVLVSCSLRSADGGFFFSVPGSVCRVLDVCIVAVHSSCSLEVIELMYLIFAMLVCA